jgi:hypothetical protein
MKMRIKIIDNPLAAEHISIHHYAVTAGRIIKVEQKDFFICLIVFNSGRKILPMNLI